MYTYQELKPGYLAMWKVAKVKPSTELNREVDAIKRGKTRLSAMEKKTGVPWYVIGALMVREAGLVNNNIAWGATLHNGEHIIGTNRKTTLVPAGLGPFKTWEDGALDAIKREGLDKLNWKGSDGIAAVAYAAEKFNGFGYRARGIPSPYLWGGTSCQRRGKFVSDGVYSAEVMDSQIGVMALIKSFQGNRGGDIAVGGAVIATGTAVAAQHYNLWDYWPYGLAVLVILGIATVVYGITKQQVPDVAKPVA